MKERSPEEWARLKNIDPEAYNVCIQADERQAQAALPAPRAGLSRAEIEAIAETIASKHAKALSGATAKAIKKYVGEQLQPITDKINAVEARIVAAQVNARRTH